MNLDERKVVELSLNDILPNRFQPRIHFSEEAINELSESIKEHGVIQPIVVRKINDKYEIIAGERRYKASTMAGKRTIPAIITDLNDKESAEIALIENVQREDLTAIEEAVSYKKILNMGYLTQEDLSSKLGKKQSTISNKLRLLNLDETVQDALLEKKISERHARSLLRLNSNDQQKMLDRIIEERLTVRKTDDEIEKMLNSKNVKNNIEILDMDDLKVEKGDINMNNNEINNNFNIPTTPIIEDIPTTPIVETSSVYNQPIVEDTVAAPIIETPSIYNQPIVEEQVVSKLDIFNISDLSAEVSSNVNQNVMAPGFMDVDRIQNQATDINIEKPVADLDTLLAPTLAPEEIKPVPVDASIFGFAPSDSNNNLQEVQPQVTPGKFFDLNNIGEIEEAATPESIENLLNNAVAPEEPVVSTEPTIIAAPENKSQMFGINLEPKNPDFIANVESKETNIDFGEPKPVIDNSDMNFDNFFNPVNDSTPTIETPTAVEEIKPIVDPIAIPQQEQVLNVNPIFGTQNIVEETPMPIPTPQPVNPPAYEIPSVDDLDDFLSNIDSTTPLSVTAQEAIVAPQAIVDEVSSSKNIDINQVSIILKEAINKINELGINADLDEFDFDDMYQAIIKVDK